jgi:hypothetical protein
MAKRSAKRFFFSLAQRDEVCIPRLGRTDLLTDENEFPHQLPETVVFGDLRFGTFDGRALRNDLGDRLSSHSMSQRIRRAVSSGVLLGAVAVGLATLTKTCGQKTGAHILDAGQTGREQIALISEFLQGE